jgi:aspartate/glutamate racemase
MIPAVGAVGPVGTVFTMHESFFRDGLKQTGIETLTPEPTQSSEN